MLMMKLNFLLGFLICLNGVKPSINFKREAIQNTASPSEMDISEQLSTQLKRIRKDLKDMKTQLSNVQAALKKMSVGKAAVQKDTEYKYYDDHFNCIGNCSVPRYLSKQYVDAFQNISLPSNCTEATASNDFNIGIYLINHEGVSPFYAYCFIKKNSKEAWTTILRREDGSVNFNRNWLDYKRGFGDLNGEFWIGLERLHGLTAVQPHELWISLCDYSDRRRNAVYSNFSVADESDGYRLTLGDYSGDAGDSFRSHESMRFSTFDNDNDLNYGNCARIFKAGWWYNDCYTCNLNGVYYSKVNKNTGHMGVIWKTWLGSSESLKYVYVFIRPIDL